MKLNINFADGNMLLRYSDDSYYSPGCETCDYGSKYTNIIRVDTSNYLIDVEFSQMYEYAFTTADAIRIFAVNLGGMTEDEFIEHIDKSVHEYGDVLKTYKVTRK